MEDKLDLILKQISLTPTLFTRTTVLPYKELVEISFTNEEDSTFNVIMREEDSRVLAEQLSKYFGQKK